jgi:hypothetical protein
MDHTGDTKITWGDNATERDQARDTFSAYVAKGFTMYRLGGPGRRGEKITEFDPQADGILAVPRMVGG